MITYRDSTHQFHTWVDRNTHHNTMILIELFERTALVTGHDFEMSFLIHLFLVLLSICLHFCESAPFCGDHFSPPPFFSQLNARNNSN